MFAVPGCYSGGLGGVAGLFFHPVHLWHCDFSGGATGSAPERLTLCLAIREGRERYPLLLLSSHTANPSPFPPILSPSHPQLSLSSKFRASQIYLHYYKPHTLQYTPVRLQKPFLCGLLYVNFLCVSLKWLFIFPIIISLYLSFLSLFFFHHYFCVPGLLYSSKFAYA